MKNIKIDWDAIEVAAKATAGTATATVSLACYVIHRPTGVKDSGHFQFLYCMI